MPQYITADVAEEIAREAGLPLAQLPAAFASASAVWRYVQANPFVDDDQLRRWGEANGLGPDRINQAIALLMTPAGQHVRQLYTLDDTPLAPPPPVPEGAAATDHPVVQALLDLIPKPKLEEAAKRAGIEGRSSMDKAELARALAEHAVATAPTAAVGTGDDSGPAAPQ